MSLGTHVSYLSISCNLIQQRTSDFVVSILKTTNSPFRFLLSVQNIWIGFFCYFYILSCTDSFQHSAYQTKRNPLMLQIGRLGFFYQIGEVEDDAFEN